MNKKFKPAAVLAASALVLSACASDCKKNEEHLHKYVKEMENGITVERYIESEDLQKDGYNWTDNTIEISKEDAEIYKVINKKKLFLGTDNEEYLYNLMETNKDYLEYYYSDMITQSSLEADGTISTYTYVDEGWTQNKTARDSSGKVRLNHYKYYGYKVVEKDGKYVLEQSPYVDDIKDIIEDYPYFKENCTQVVHKDMILTQEEIETKTAADFNYFPQPDLSTYELHQ